MARSESPIPLIGGTGTGKELFAHAVHRASRRAKGPFVAINVAAFPEDLLESGPFGYEDGAFTGAKKGGRPRDWPESAGAAAASRPRGGVSGKKVKNRPF